MFPNSKGSGTQFFSGIQEALSLPCRGAAGWLFSMKESFNTFPAAFPMTNENSAYNRRLERLLEASRLRIDS